MLKIWREAQPFLFSMMRRSASTPSSINVNDRLCFAAIDELERFLENHVRDKLREQRELPSFGSITSSSFGPIQLNGRKSV